MEIKHHFIRFPARLAVRLRPLLDLTAWILLVLSIVPLFFIDPPMVKTLVQWTAYALALAGISVFICRIVLPQVDMTEWVARAREGDVAASVVVFGVMFLLAIIFLSLVLWSKA